MAEHTPISPKGMTALVILLVVSGFINVSLISMVGIWSCEDEDLILDPVASTHDKNMVSHRNFGIVLDNSTEGAAECTCPNFGWSILEVLVAMLLLILMVFLTR